ncbi:hypothetical protein IB024_01760 [Brucella sp. 6810]|uniref:hypothetical protein n=1 Tax=Brucella sp. 6810 TaxID=2769351 RepID=UPI00165B88DF|nr:hypothetical protein [Brucella sp. 6810]QNQ62509.1 hypothetical protein IB024_01760 [Brucella sp. 6810]
MNPIEKLIFAFSACLFAAIALCSTIIFGGEWARNAAIFASFLACMSQFVAQDLSNKAYRTSVYLAYGSVVVFLLAFFWLVRGW